MTCIPGFNGDSSSEASEVMEEVDFVQPGEGDLDETALAEGAVLDADGNPADGDDFEYLSF